MIYFGNKGSMRWVKAPTVDFDASRVGWTSQVQFLNGGTSIRSSVASHANASLAWGLMSNEEAREILRPLRSGQPVYWVDPFVDNQLPQAWAEPWRAGYDGPILDNSDVRPKLTPQSAMNNYPTEAADYTLTADTAGLRKSVWLPIPPGYTMHIGATGQIMSGTAQLQIQSDSGSPYNMTFSDPASADPYTVSINGGSGGNGVTFRLVGNGVLRLRSIMAHLAPTGSQPRSDGFVEGEGMAGALPAAQPSESRYSAVLNGQNRTVSVRLVEVGSWQ